MPQGVENKMSDMNLAEDIIIEILSRLPVKSLLRFKCVCKEWHKLIESPVFINKHFNGETNHSCLLVQYVPPEGRTSHFAFFPDKDLNGTPPAHEDLYKQLEIGQIFGPVNGLFLLHLYLSSPYCLEDPLALWNPATRQLRRILCPKLTLPSHFSMGPQQFGFGFDCLSNDYKVIWFRSYANDEIGHLCGDTEVTIYSLSKDSWSSPVEMICQPYDSLRNTYINGAYYWLSWHKTDRLTFCISVLSFDMASEVFRDIEGPVNLDFTGLDELMLYNDHLALLISDYCSLDQIFYYIWIMKEEGCWIKHLKIGPFQDWAPAKGIWKNNELLIPTDKSGRLLLYNVDSYEIKDLGLQSTPSNSLFYTYSYKESLVSVKGGSEDRKVFDSCAEERKRSQFK